MMVFGLNTDNTLFPLAADTKVSDQTWERLAASIKEEKEQLAPVSLTTLKKRYEQNELMIVLHQSEIICCITFSKVLSGGMVLDQEKMMKTIPLSAQHHVVYLMMTGWTAPKFRRKGISYSLRKKWFEKNKTGTVLCLGLSTLEKTIFLVQKLGATPVTPTKYPFVYALSSLNTKQALTTNRCLRENNAFWVSDEALAKQLNEDIAQAVKVSAHEWADILNVDPRWDQWKQ